MINYCKKITTIFQLLQVNVDSVDMIALHRITSEVLDRQKINRLIKCSFEPLISLFTFIVQLAAKVNPAHC